jgi:excisionase family DNA binding protein
MAKDELRPRSKALREALEWARLHESEQDLLTIKQACRRLMISRTTLYKQMEDGKLSYLHIGSRRYIPVRAVSKFIDLLEEEGRKRRSNDKRTQK